MCVNITGSPAPHIYNKNSPSIYGQINYAATNYLKTLTWNTWSLLANNYLNVVVYKTICGQDYFVVILQCFSNCLSALQYMEKL